ncbi:MAG: cobalamin-binding protein [Deltaproteobacteria bacterium]|nr:cobalamin-binding protein [Deltaproteobacteria bacterium]
MAERIACLLPSATEIVCALGLGARIVGVSHECDFPAEVVGRPVLTEPKLDPRGSSAAIDAQVRRLVADGLSVYRIREAELRAAAPDLIVTQQQCEVCAVSYAEVEAAARAWLEAPAAIVSLQPNRLDEVLDDFVRVADAAGVPQAGARLVADSRARLDRLRARLAPARSRPRVACIEWLDPLMVAGNWVPELVALAGGTYDLVAAGAHSPALDWDALVAAQPDVVIVMPCGFPLAQTRPELPALTARPEWQALPAVRNGRAYAVDGNAYLNRPGPRLVDSAELLAGLIQPGFCATLLPAGAWERI